MKKHVSSYHKISLSIEDEDRKVICINTGRNFKVELET